MDIEQMESDGISVKIIDRTITKALSKRWLWYIKKRMCDTHDGISLQDYKELMKFSAYHYDLLNNKDLQKYMQKDVLKLPQVHRPDVQELKVESQMKDVEALIIHRGLIEYAPDKESLPMLVSMMKHMPRSALLVYMLFVENEQDQNKLKQLVKGLQNYEHLDLDKDNLYQSL